jgi:hypothetical protein
MPALATQQRDHSTNQTQEFNGILLALTLIGNEVPQQDLNETKPNHDQANYTQISHPESFLPLMTSRNDITTANTNSLALTDENPLDLDSLDPVSAIANTPDHDAWQARRYPAWFHHLIQHLRHYRPWRLIIKSDNTIDLEYLAALALQAQQRARPSYSPAQLNLFPNDGVIATTDQLLPYEATPVTANAARREQPTTPSFRVITGANHRNNKTAITLPDDILTIAPGEQLHEFLRRVADAAVAATIYTYGSTEAAFARLGSKAPNHTLSPSRPALSLAPSPTATQTRDHKARS